LSLLLCFVVRETIDDKRDSLFVVRCSPDASSRRLRRLLVSFFEKRETLGEKRVFFFAAKDNIKRLFGCEKGRSQAENYSVLQGIFGFTFYKNKLRLWEISKDWTENQY
jgi:hypothetical protein